MCANAVSKVYNYKYSPAQAPRLTVFCVKLTYNSEFTVASELYVAEYVELPSVEICAFLCEVSLLEEYKRFV